MATANEDDDTTNCPVCFEAYGEAEDHVPRLLPCTHTVCEACVKRLLNRASLTCPECRMRHPAENEVRSFPQNKYILANIRRKKVEESTEDDAEKTTKMVEKCKQHGKEMAFYCNEKSCKMVISPLCMLQDHRSHDVVDVQQVTKHGEAETELKLFLLSTKAKLVAVEEEMKQNYENNIEEIQSQKEELIRKLEERYDKMVQDMKDRMSKLNHDIHCDISAIDKNITEIDEVDESTSVERIKRIEAEVRERVSDVRIYNYYKYEKSIRRSEDDLDELCGKLTEKMKEVDFTRDNTTDSAALDSLSDMSLPEPPEYNLAALVHEVLEGGGGNATNPFTQSCQVRIQGGGPGGPGPPLTLGFEAPKLSIFGPYLIFP